MEYPNWFGNYAARFFAHHLTHLAGRPELRFLRPEMPGAGPLQLWFRGIA